MRRPLVAGNWKMHGSKVRARELAAALCRRAGGLRQVDIVLCPPFVYLPLVEAALEGSGIAHGAQSICAEDDGAFTGEISGRMLVDCGCRYVIVGHSERRGLFGEDDATVAAKTARAQQHGLTPIVCLGESLAQREAGQTLDWVGGQLRAVIDRGGAAAFAGAVVAYEPIWAIGTGHTATPQQAQEVHAHIRGVLREYGETLARDTRILYGGSVKAENAASLFAEPDIDGALVGGASLDAEEFALICEAAV